MTRAVVHLTTFLQGGAGRTIVALARAARTTGRRVIVGATLTPEPGFETYVEYRRALGDAGVELVEVDSTFKRNLALNRAAARALRDAIGDARVEYIHAHAAVPSRIGLALVRERGTPVPVVQTMHGWGRGKSPAQVAEDLVVMRAVDTVVFPSEAARRELRAVGGLFAGDAVVPNGIPRERAATALPAVLEEARRARAAGARVLATIGSLTAQKNQRLLVEALPAILRRHDVHAVLVGEGPETDAIRARAVALGVSERVHLPGYLPDGASALQIADALVQPSLAESFGVAPLEAFRARVPVAASRHPALAEIVRPGETGWSFEAADPASLAGALLELLDTPPDRREAIVQRAAAEFLARFTEERMIEGYAAVYARARQLKL